jgi:SAM-dependent methyltransferase
MERSRKRAKRDSVPAQTRRAALERRLAAEATTPTRAAEAIEALSRFALEAMRGSDMLTMQTALEMIRRRSSVSAPSAADGLLLARAVQRLALAGVDDASTFAPLVRAVEIAAPLMASNARCEARAALALADLDAPAAFAALHSRSASPGPSSEKLRPPPPRLWDSAALCALWRYSKSVPKVEKKKKARSEDADPGGSWPPTFADPTRPLLVDVGCGFGASSLSFAASDEGRTFNVLGADRARHALAYAKGVARRRAADFGGRTQFVVADGMEVLHWCRHCYPGPILFVLLQFPTPYALSSDCKNVQLPTSATSNQFMLNPKLLRLVLDVAADGCTIVHHSNVEDVAVTVRAAIERLGRGRVRAMSDDGEGIEKVEEDKSEKTEELPLRLQRWMAMGGARARGPGWLRRSCLPRTVRTETEAQYEATGKAVHRCALIVARKEGC